MKTYLSQDERIAQMTFAKVYPLYVNKIERKGRTIAELDQVITWLTGYDTAKLKDLMEQNVSFESFFEHARLHPNAALIKGLICGHRVEDIQNPLTQKVRYLDKLVDELAKGKALDKILRIT